MNRNSTILAVVIVIALIGAWFFMHQTPAPLATPPTRMSAPAPVPSTQSIQEGMQGDMEVEGSMIDTQGASSMTAKSVDPALEQLRQASCFPKQQLTPDELLPKDNSSLWAQMNPNGSGSLKDRNFLQSGFHIGINTVGQTLRNANLQIRSEPPNPQVAVSPWLNSTIEPDINRRPFEIGGCA
jgi:hypothetical protein